MFESQLQDGYEDAPRSYGGGSRGVPSKQEPEAYKEPVPKPGQRGGPPAPPPAVEEQPDFLVGREELSTRFG